MVAVRRNILTDETARKNYVQGVKLLKQEQLGPTTADLGIPGPPVQVSTYDLFVAWHHLAMDTFTPPTQSDRNAAHCDGHDQDHERSASATQGPCELDD